jgi:hypothetical protein
MIDGTRIKTLPNDEFEYAIWEQVDDYGCYSPDTNTIYILYPIDVVSTISHEFLHMVMFNEHGEYANSGLDYICKNRIDSSGIGLL